jgi:hypothetical protein
VVRALGLSACLAAAAGCHGLTTGEQLGGAGPRDTGVGRRDGGADAIAVRTTTDAAVSTVPSGDPPGDGGGVACAPARRPAHDAGVAPPAPAWAPATTLWNVLASGDVVRRYPPRPEEATWDASEVPIAVSAHGDRVITGAQTFADCGNWPGFTSRIHDVAADTVVDELPPGVTSTSADLNVLAIGEVLWCAR